MSQTRQQAITRVTLIGALLDAVLAGLKIVGGILFHSAALIADGIHSASDVVTDAFVIAANKFSAQQPDQSHPYGHRRFETLATVALGITLVVVAGSLAWEVSKDYLAGHTSMLSPLALAIAAISVASKEWIFRYTLKVAQQTQSQLLTANAWHSRSDALSSIVVFIGLAGALMGVHWLEPLAAVVVAFMVARMGVHLVIEAIQELADKGVDAKTEAEIAKQAKQVPGVVSVHQIRARWHAGKVLLDLHVQVDAKASVSEGHFLGDRVAQMIRQHNDQVIDITVHIDHFDDSKQGIVHLPHRVFIEQALGAYPELSNWSELTIHYSPEGVTLDAHYHAPMAGQQDAVAKLTGEHDWLNSMGLWYRTLAHS